MKLARYLIRLTGRPEYGDGLERQSIDLPRSLSPLSASQAYRTAIGGRDLVLVPHFTVDTERYNTYFRIP